MSTIDWARLVSQNRAKALGVPWTEQDLKAIQEGVPAEAVRDGVLTLKEYEDSTEKSKPPTERMNEAQKRAIELGINFDPKAVEIQSLEKEISLAEKKLEKEGKDKEVKKAVGVNANKKWENMDYKDQVAAARGLGMKSKGAPKKADVLEFLNNQ